MAPFVHLALLLRRCDNDIFILYFLKNNLFLSSSYVAKAGLKMLIIMSVGESIADSLPQ